MDKAHGMADDESQQRIVLLQLTEPELAATLLEIDCAKKSLRRHSFATASFHAASDAKMLHELPRSGSEASGSELAVSDSPGCHSKTLKAVKKSALQTRLLRDSKLKSNLTAQQKEILKEQQTFLNRRAALYKPAATLTARNPPAHDFTPSSRHSRHHVSVVDIEESESGSLLRLRDNKVSQTWQEPKSHYSRHHVSVVDDWASWSESPLRLRGKEVSQTWKEPPKSHHSRDHVGIVQSDIKASESESPMTLRDKEATVTSLVPQTWKEKLCRFFQ